MRNFCVSMLLACAACAAPRAAAQTQASPPASTVSPPATPSGIVGLDAMTATVFQEGQSSFSGIALRLRVHPSALVSSIDLLPTFEYWQNTSHIDEFDIRTTRRDATLSGDVRFTFPRTGARPYVGAGLGLHFIENDLSAPRYNEPHATSSTVKGALEAMGGLQFEMSGRLGSFLELKFLDVTHYRQLKLDTGLSWNF